jgi:hypothetical protein
MTFGGHHVMILDESDRTRTFPRILFAVPITGWPTVRTQSVSATLSLPQ